MTYLYMALAFIYTLFSTFGINLAGGENYKTYTMSYGSNSREVVDIYVPESAPENEYNGVVLYIPGGAWVTGTRKARPNEVRKLAGEGYIVAAMDYRVYSAGNGVTVSTMMDDVDKAVSRIKEFSEENNLNITKLALMGYSAGSHIASLYAYTRADTCPIELVFLSERVGPSDFHESVWGSETWPLVEKLSGVNITDEMKSDGRAEEIVRSISPACQITENSVPTLAAYAGADMVVPSGNATSMKNALAASGIDYTFMMYPQSGHAMWFNPGTANKFWSAQDQYLLKYFGY